MPPCVASTGTRVRMPLALLLTLLCTSLVYADEQTWTFTRSGKLSVKADGVSVLAVTPSVSGDFLSATLTQGPISWRSSPTFDTALDYSSLPPTLQAHFDSINVTGTSLLLQQLSSLTDLYWARDRNHVPSVYIFGRGTDTSVYFYCARTAQTLSTVTCSSLPTSSPATFNATFTSLAGLSLGDPTVVTLTLRNESIPADSVLLPLLALAAFRAEADQQSNAAIAQARQQLDDRRELQRQVAGFLWAMLILTMACVIGLLVFWLSYLSPRRYTCGYVSGTWFVAVTGLTLLISAFTGLFGWIVVGTLWVFFSIGISILYCVKRQQTDVASIEDINLSADDISFNNELKGFRRRYPVVLSRPQKLTLGVIFTAFTVFVVVAIIVYFTWYPDDYVIWDRQGLALQAEIQPANIKRAMALIYSYQGLATFIRMGIFFSWTTSYCGERYHTVLADQTKEKAIYGDFIVRYSIDMSDYEPSDYKAYATVNDWFKRTLRPGARPIFAPSDASSVISSADCRVMVFPIVPPDQQFWLKGESFSLTTLTNSADFVQGSMVIHRLAPQDYHRFHSPVTGNIVEQYSLSGGLQSVSADGMTSGNGAIYNQRIVTIIQTAQFGKVAFVAIGATCVGSVVMTKEVSASVVKGQELGYFQFGGSTTAVVFPSTSTVKPAVLWDADVLRHSRNNVEVLVRMGQSLGVANN